MKKIITAALAAMLMVPAVTQAADKKLTVAGIVFQEDQFMKLALMGMKDAAEREGINLLTSNTANQISKELQVVNTYIARGVDAIVITSLDPQAASIPVIKAAHDKGIKIVSFGTSLAADFPVSTVQSDDVMLGTGSGKAAADYIRAHYADKKEIKVAIVNYKAQLPGQSNARQQGFWDEIKDIPGVHLIAEVSAPVAEEAVKKVTDIITANPDIDLIYGCNTGGTVGSVLAVKNAGKKIPVFGIDLDKQLVGFLQSKDNILQASTGQDPEKIGRLAVESAVKSLRGEEVPKQVIVPGITLSRNDPETIEAFAKTVK